VDEILYVIVCKRIKILDGPFSFLNFRTSLNSATCFWENMEKTLDPLRLALRLPRLLALAEPESFGVPVGVGAFSSAGAGSGSGAGAASSFFLVFFFFSLSA